MNMTSEYFQNSDTPLVRETRNLASANLGAQKNVQFSSTAADILRTFCAPGKKPPLAILLNIHYFLFCPNLLYPRSAA